MLYGIYNIEEQCFTYSSAGINVPPIIIRNTGEIMELESNGFPICKLGDYFIPFMRTMKYYWKGETKLYFIQMD